jgi:hypothetical protein
MQSLSAEQRTYIQDHFRVPVLSHRRGPDWIACLTADSNLPTDLELSLLRSLVEYEISLFPLASQAALLALPLAHDLGRTGMLFRKGDGWDPVSAGWHFSRVSWSGAFIPTHAPRPFSLIEVIDFEESLWNLQRAPSPEWQAWTASHPDLFSAFPASDFAFLQPLFATERVGLRQAGSLAIGD